VDTSLVTPPDTDLLTWGPVMGIDEAIARSNASRLLEQALDDGTLVPSTRGYAAACIKQVERWLTTPHPSHMKFVSQHTSPGSSSAHSVDTRRSCGGRPYRWPNASLMARTSSLPLAS
jgi:hypothetical protein